MFNTQHVRSGAFALFFTIALAAIHMIAMPPAAQAQTTVTAGQLIITEFRLRGPNGANDEFIEIHNRRLRLVQ